MAKWNRGNFITIDFGDYEPTKEERFALYWCVKNKIIVYAEEKENPPWRIRIKLDKKIHTSPESYGQDEVIKKIFEYYLYYANKYRPEDEL